MKNVLLTGASGFVGRHVYRALKKNGYWVRAAIRDSKFQESSGQPLADEYVQIDEISGETVWLEALNNIDYVVHLAARVHVMNDRVVNPISEFRRVNRDGTLRLGHSCVQAGIKRFIFLSSAKVHGEGSAVPYTEASPIAPEDPYSVSKAEAEQELVQLVNSSNGKMSSVTLRPPLVYGPGVKANFLNLIRLVLTGVPLPLGAIHNQRSIIYVGNLADAIVHSLNAEVIASQTYLVSDGVDFSTPDLVRAIATAANRRSRLIAIPEIFLTSAAKILGKGPTLARLTGSLRLDISSIQKSLEWKPKIPPEEGFRETVRWFTEGRTAW
ncbi:MAG TPA: NAD-dependent epimerase/dehydratase family protein [Bdellovibrionota bacterium]|nr:NAD-dependent epimerase/dehydratase family protein [Bdellovibrionota bacterium]